VVLGAKDEQLFFFGIPVPAQAAKCRRAIVDGVGGDADVGLAEGHDLAFEEGVLR
jgi:hypothetical protein